MKKIALLVTAAWFSIGSSHAIQSNLMIDIEQYDVVFDGIDIGSDHNKYSSYEMGPITAHDMSCGYNGNYKKTSSTQAIVVPPYSEKNDRVVASENQKQVFSFIQNRFCGANIGDPKCSVAINLDTYGSFQANNCFIGVVEPGIKLKSPTSTNVDTPRSGIKICMNKLNSDRSNNSCDFTVVNTENGSVTFQFRLIRNTNVETQGTRILFGENS